MDLDYYIFALFLFGLFCIGAVLCKLLFSNVKRQRKLLDEKETGILQLYQKVEGIIEEFDDQVRAATDEIKEFENRMALIEMAQQHQQQQQPPAAPPAKKPQKKEAEPKPGRSEDTKESTRIRAASEVLELAEKAVIGSAGKPAEAPPKSSGAVFQRIIDETLDDDIELSTDTQPKQGRTKAILDLSEEGKTVAQIARKLGITQSEVALVIGLGPRKGGAGG